MQPGPSWRSDRKADPGQTLLDAAQTCPALRFVQERVSDDLPCAPSGWPRTWAPRSLLCPRGSGWTGVLRPPQGRFPAHFPAWFLLWPQSVHAQKPGRTASPMTGLAGCRCSCVLILPCSPVLSLSRQFKGEGKWLWCLAGHLGPVKSQWGPARSLSEPSDLAPGTPQGWTGPLCSVRRSPQPPPLRQSFSWKSALAATSAAGPSPVASSRPAQPSPLTPPGAGPHPYCVAVAD